VFFVGVNEQSYPRSLHAALARRTPFTTIKYSKPKLITTLGFEAGMSHDKVVGHDPILQSDFATQGPEGRGESLAPLPVKRSVLSMSRGDWQRWMVERGYPAYRARQLLDWVIRKRADAFELMSDLPKSLRQELESEWTVFSTWVVYHGAADDGADKLVLACHDGRRIECVLMSGETRRTVCISTQVGCGIGCTFCASGLKGLVRNLSTDELLEQVLRLRNLLPLEDTVTHIVVMGMGESLANFDNLVNALDRLCSTTDGLGISQRRVTISTVGLPEKILKLAALDRQYHLAVSLHAPTEALRNTLVPVNDKIGLNAVLSAADAYFEQTGRQVTYEYVLLRDINDRPTDAQALARLLANRRAHVNLIPYNSVEGLPYERPTLESISRFTTILRGSSVSVTVRKTKGRAIDAACGQLRRRLEQVQALDGVKY
jgi:23S rRNA (adenine2503-C2)-methyltransferase